MSDIRMEEYFGSAPDDTNEENGTGKSPGYRNFKKKLPKDQKKKIAMRKEIRKNKQERKKRIIIRNLSFKVKEEDLKSVFSKFGDVVDVTIPKKPDGKMRGFAFIQYKKFQSAIEAVRNLNYKKLDGRPIAVDYAVAKDKYQHITSSKHTTNIPGKRPKDGSDGQTKEKEFEVDKTDSDESSKSDLEDESADESVSDTHNDHVQKFLKEFDADQEPLQDNEDEQEESQSPSHSSSESDDDDSKDLKSMDASSADDSDDDDEMEDDVTEPSSSKRKKALHTDSQEPLHKKRNPSHDVNEGKTLFIRNVSFDSSQDSLKRTMEAFGPVKYCLLCIDKFTELPRGTAFVKFENKEDADKAIEKSFDTDAEGIYLDGRKLSFTLAVSQEELQAGRESGAKTGKDKRNLYLLKEGLIRHGSVEAQGVSQADLAKRAKLEILKRNKLKNFQFFVSDKRLCIHNIPSYYSDDQLRKLFKNAAGPRAKIIEAKIMRNLKKISPQSIAESKGFGFVGFEKHEDALKALKEINNNPDIFSPQKRPIVEFAVENMNALLTKQRRQEKSRMKIKKESENSEANHPEEEENLMSLKFRKKTNVNKKRGKTDGVRRMRINRNTTNMSHRKKSGSKKNQMENKLSGQRKPKFKVKGQHDNNGSPTKENSQKKKKNKRQKKNKASSQSADSGHFTEMVNKYKQKLLSSM